VFFPQKLSNHQTQIIQQHSHFYNCLTSSEKRVFQHRVVVFIREHHFVGNGIAISDEIKILIATMAVTLTFGLHRYLFSRVKTIIIYPETYYSTILEQYHKGETNPKLHLVVFSWIDFLEGIKNKSDNINLALHEFSHALHFSFLKGNSYSAINFRKQFNLILRYLKNEENRQKLVESNYLRSYAFKNKYEFLAVLIEHFFETPQTFQNELPEIFNLVRQMLNLDILKIYSRKT
jgi:Mlc titration factor MtfA (ptsG expression regulator)